MNDPIWSAISNMIGYIVSFITTAPVCYLFYMVFVIWVFDLFMKFRRIAR